MAKRDKYGLVIIEENGQPATTVTPTAPTNKRDEFGLTIVGEAGPTPTSDTPANASIQASGEAAAGARPGVIKSFADRGVEAAKGVAGLAGSAVKAAASGPLEQAKFLPRLAGGMYEGAVDAGAGAIARQFPQGMDNQPENAKFYKSAARGGAAAVPVIGPYAMNKVSDIEEGNWRKVAGETIFDAVMAKAGPRSGASAASKVSPALAEVSPTLARLRSMGSELGADVGDIAKSRMWGPVMGGAIGHMVGGPVGASIGTAAELIYSTRMARIAKLEKAAAKAKSAAEKATITDSIKAAKAEVASMETSEAIAGRTIAKTEKEAAKATEAGTKLDQQIAKDQLKKDAELAATLAKRQTARETASIQSAGSEVRILEASQKAEAAAQAELQAADAAVEKAGAREMAQALKTQAAATEKANKAAEATRLAQEKADKAQIHREMVQRRQLDEQAKKEAAKKAKETPAPEAAPTPAAPAEPAVVTQLKAMKPTETPAAKPGAELKAALDESAPKVQLDAPEDVAKFTRAVQGILHSVPRAKNGPRAAYGVADLEAAPALQKGHAGVSPEMKAKIIQTTVRVGADAERVANGLANQGMTVGEIVAHLKDTQGMPTNAALDFAEPAINALGPLATPAQRASVKAIANRNNKKLKLEDLSD